eukprot:c57082_g1_i1 orf=1-180(-)
MSGLMDKVEGMADNKLNQDAQPGNQVEGRADNAANDKVNEVANDAGVPQQDDGFIDKVAD